MAIIIIPQANNTSNYMVVYLYAAKLKLDEYNTSVMAVWREFNIGNGSMDVASAATEIATSGAQTLGFLEQIP
jgi:hypothetical protein